MLRKTASNLIKKDGGLVTLFILVFLVVSVVIEVSSSRTVFWNVLYHSNYKVLVIGLCSIIWRNSVSSAVMGACAGAIFYNSVSLVVTILSSYYLVELQKFLLWMSDPYLGFGFSVIAGVLIFIIAKLNKP